MLTEFILTADWHLRGDKPRCRLDANWLESQRKAIQQVVGHCLRLNLPLVIAGDIFNTPRVSTEVLNMMLTELSPMEPVMGCQVYVMAGNHDLPYHDYGNVETCNFGTLRHVYPELSAEASLFGGVAFQFGKEEDDGSKVVFTHQLVFEDEAHRPFAGVGKTADELLLEFPKAQWIFCGDYHHSFVHEVTQVSTKTGKTRQRYVVNPGCLLRQASDMKDYQPVILHVNLGVGEVTPIIIEDDAELVTDDYLRKEEERDSRIESFLEVVKSAEVSGLSFRDNLEKKMKKTAIRPGVKQVITHVLEVANNERTGT